MGYHAGLVVTFFFSLTHLTCMALHHTVVIRLNTSVTYQTLCDTSGHLVIYRECYGFERAFFLFSVVFYVALLSVFSSFSWARQFNLKVSMVSYWTLKQSPGPTICLNHNNPQKIYIYIYIYIIYYIIWYIVFKFKGQGWPVTEHQSLQRISLTDH